MQFGMPTLIENDTVEQNAALCRQLGLDFVELNTNLPICQLEHGTTSLRRIAEQYDIFFTLHLDENLHFADFNERVSLAYMDTMRRAILAARELNIPVLTMHERRRILYAAGQKGVSL